MTWLRNLVLAALYGALMAGANPAAADVTAAQSARAETMLKLQFQDAETPSVTAFQDFEGAPLDLSQHAGKYVVLNFWATWCAPCRKEMPGLNRLQEELGGDDFAVVTLATGRNAPAAMKRFFEDAGLDQLPLHRDPEFALAEALGVHGLPYTVILSREGQIIARLQGDAEWDGDSAIAVVRALLQDSTG